MNKITSILVDKISAITINSNEDNVYSRAQYIPAGKRISLFSGKAKHDTWKVYTLFRDDYKCFENPEDAINYIKETNIDYVCLGADNQLYYEPSVTIYYAIGDREYSSRTYFSTLEKATEFYNDINEQISKGVRLIKF